MEVGDERRDRTSTEDMKIGGALTVAITANDCMKEGGVAITANDCMKEGGEE